MLKKILDVFTNGQYKQEIIEEILRNDLRHYHDFLLYLFGIDRSDWEFANDLVFTDFQNELISYLKGRYKSGDYHKYITQVPEKLRDEYVRLHENICFLLH